MNVNPIASTAGIVANEQSKLSNEGDRGGDIEQVEAVVSSISLQHKNRFELTISEEAIVKAIEKANRAMVGEPKQFEYSVHKPSGVVMVKVINTETKEVIREFPPEKILDLIDKLQELSGAIIDEKR